MKCTPYFIVSIVVQCFAINTESEETTKPPLHREQLPWPEKPRQTGNVKGVKTHHHYYHHTHHSPLYHGYHNSYQYSSPSKYEVTEQPEEGKPLQPAPTNNSSSNSYHRHNWMDPLGLFSYFMGNSHNHHSHAYHSQAHHYDPSKWQHYHQHGSHRRYYSPSDWQKYKNSDNLCPYKATGLFLYPSDCRKFVNCWKGRGSIQVCAAGTVFNPKTKECDFPGKVECHDTSVSYDGNDENLGAQESNWKPVLTPSGHGGVQPPPHGHYIVVDQNIQTTSTNKPRQSFNVERPFNIPPIFSNQQYGSNTSNDGDDDTALAGSETKPVSQSGCPYGTVPTLYLSNYPQGSKTSYHQICTPAYMQSGQSGSPQSGQSGYPQSGQSAYSQPGQSGYPQSGQSGYPQTGQSGYPQRGQSGYPQSGQSGYPQTGQSGSPQPGKSGYPQPGQSSSPQSGQSGYPQPEQSGYPQPGQSGYPQTGESGYPQTGQSGYPQSGQSSSPQPGQSGYPQTGQSGYPQSGQSSSPQSGQSGYPQPGQSGYPQPGQSGSPQSGQSGFLQPGQSGYPQTGQSGYPQSGQSSSPQSGQSGYPQPGQSGYPQTGQSGYPQSGPARSPQSGQSGYPQAGQSGYAQPGQSGYAQPGQSGYPQAGQSGYPQPGQSGYAQPGQSGYPQAGQSGYPQAGQSGYPQPGQSEYPQTGQSGYAQSGQSGYPQPGQSGYPQLGQSGYPQPGQSGYPHTGQSGSPQSGYPQTGQSGYPQSGQSDSGPKVKCSEGASGLFPHPDCTKFLSCDHGRTFVMVCGPGTVFNPKISVCDFPYNVDCEKTDSGSHIEQVDVDASGSEEYVSPGSEIFDPAGSEIVEAVLTEIEPISVIDDPECQNLTGVIDVRLGGKCVFPPVSVDSNSGINITTQPTQGSETYPTRFPPGGRPDYIRLSRPQGEISPPPSTPQPTPEGLPSNGFSSGGDILISRLDTEIEEFNKPDETTTESNSKTKTHTTRMVPQMKPPASKQVARLRNGVKSSEGYLEIQLDPEGWGIVCDKPNKWSIKEANIVCKQLGYERGAELTWQGRPSQTDDDVTSLRKVVVDVVECNGTETSIMECQLEKDNTCQPERDGVWIRCYNNRASQCMPGEISFNGRCYQLVVPKEEARVDLVGFSQGEALAHCQSRGGHLYDITSQAESDFISEWLIGQNYTSSIMTAGVGVSVLGRSLWIWEGSSDSFEYQNWWPGWSGGHAYAPQTYAKRALCVVAKRYYPCSAPTKTKTAVNKRLCDAEHYFWDVEDCGIMSTKHPYVCERKADKIGCVIRNGADYTGHANVTEMGTACLQWDSPLVIPALKYRISEITRRTRLTGHNYCRNVGGSEQQPWCFVPTKTGISKEFCDIPPCRIQETNVEKSVAEAAYTCGPNLFACQLGECIPSVWLCDGQPDCKNGYDELNCTGGLEKFSKYSSARLLDNEIEKWLHTSAANCATRCLETTAFVCRSFSHSSRDQVCLLSEHNIGLSGKLSLNERDWEYYEMNSRSIKCDDMFVCGNGKCINKSLACNGNNDCGDKTDERNCSAVNLGYEIRLAGGTSANEGRIEVKILGEWGTVCDDQFDMRDAEVVCRELGFNLGAADIRPHSAFPLNNNTKPLFLVDDLQCRGNETTIRDCEFGGWGMHDCGDEEVAGVVCKVPGITCASNFWQCEASKECIPISYLCDNVPDCDDGSDEVPARCKLPTEIRLAGGDRSGSGTSVAGRVEVRRFGVWGTICDDDFGVAEATVICKTLGYKGPATAKKEAAFGEGEGVIWLDQVHCAGNETAVDQCLHQQWGQHDCKHQEDVAVVCSHNGKQSYDITRKPQASRSADIASNIFSTDSILAEKCGTIDENLHLKDSEVTAKVVKGHEVYKGTHPWQASLRVRTSVKSLHWCGAVVISPLHILTSAHCLQDYTKSAYFVRAGDFDTELNDGTEQEADIETIYIHEDFDKGPHLNNDIALIKLKNKGLRFSSWIRPVCLPPMYADYIAGMNCTISGWGSSGRPGAGYSRRLKAIAVPILKEAECRAPYVYGESALSEGMFCAGSLQGGADSCQGDSGGPFVCSVNGRSVLYGITSWGHGCGRSNKPGVYTRVGIYMDWIRDRITDSLSGR